MRELKEEERRGGRFDKLPRSVFDKKLFCLFVFTCSLLREHSIDGTGWAPTRTLKVNKIAFIQKVFFS